MEEHGPIFKAYVDLKKLNKSHLARVLVMSKQNLYQLFKSREFQRETIECIEKVLGTTWNVIEKTSKGNIDINIQGETKKPASQGEEGLKEDLIAALKMNNALLEARVKELEGRTAPLPSIETGTADHLSRIRADMNYLMSLAVGYSKRALELQVPDKKKFLAEVRTIQQSVIADPEALLRQGTSSGTDDN